MRKFKVCLAVLLIAMMMGGSAWALDAVDHVKVAPNGKGDLIIFPYFYAYPGDYSTKIIIINTSNDHSVVAKVIYRSFNWSEELKDHLLFLSPNDVWVGYLVNVNGTPRLQSNDDSILGRLPSGTAYAEDADFGNITPVDVALEKTTCTDDANTMGYIEVIEAASRLESEIGTGYKPGQRVAKRHIYDWYYNDKIVNGTTIQNGPYSPVNVLTGYQENSFGWGSTLKQASVFADYFNYDKLDLARKTWLGLNANNSLAELEAAIAKYEISMPYIAKPNGDGSVHIFNFPTKESLINEQSTCSYYRNNPNSPFWLYVNSKCLIFDNNIYDLSENKSTSIKSPFSPYKDPSFVMCGEVQFNIIALSNDPLYTEGWIRYNFKDASGTDHLNVVKTGETKARNRISFTGVPVLASVLYWSVERDNPAEGNAAYSDGVVKIDAVPMGYYQYSD